MIRYILSLVALFCCVGHLSTFEIDPSGMCHIDDKIHCAVGYGTYPLRGDACSVAVKEALRTGYSIIDTATFYGNLDGIAEALRGQNRSTVYLISKVWPDAQTPQRLREDVKNTLAQLETSYLDAYLLHWPHSSVDIQATLYTLRDLQRQGLVRHIGLSNVTVNHLKRVSDYGFRINWVQIEMHPGFCDFELLYFCRENGIGVQAWAPLGRGRLNHDPLLISLGTKYGKTPAQIALRWIVQHECIPLPGSKDPAHMRQNREIFDFELSPKEMGIIDAQAKNGPRERLSIELGLGFADEFDLSYDECWPVKNIISPRIAVIGAGFAGLTAAYELTKRGYTVTVYEARNRVGGRVFSVIMQDPDGTQHAAELGAQNICDGGEAENLRALAAELGLPIKITSYNFYMMGYHDGDTITFPESHLQNYNFTSESLGAHLAELCIESQNMAMVLQKLFPDDELLRQFFTLRLACYEGGSTERLSPLCVSTLHRMIESKLYQGPQEGDTHQILSIAGGNGKLTEDLALRLGDHVYLNKILTSIAKTNDGAFMLRFQDGDLIIADSVVLTIPCPAYRDIVFEDGVLPEEQLAAIRSIEYGGNAKILVPVNEKISSPPIGNNHSITWKIGANDPVTFYYREPYGCFTQTTLQDALDHDLPIVSALHTVRNNMPEPCMARDESFAIYEGIVGQSWPLDPFAKGSYSYINAGKEVIFMATGTYAGEPMRTLFAPAGNLFFAGEHTTVLLDVLGTMEAAVESGMRIARIITSVFPTEADQDLKKK